MRFFFYSHDGMGLGHVRRHIAIASALHEATPQAQVLLATSVDEVASLGLPPNVDTLKLPGLRKIANGDYSSRRLGISKSQMRSLRSAILCEAVKAFRPDVMLVDKHPFGASAELVPALDAAKAAGARLALGLRDILDDPTVVIREWEKDEIPDRVSDYYDLVLVYGVRSIFDPIQHYHLPVAVAARTKYCGYVIGPATCAWCHDRCPHALPDPVVHPMVLCTVGGGEDGVFLLEAFLRACIGARWKGLAISGPRLPDPDLQTLRHIAVDTGVTVLPFVPCLSNLFWTVDAIVCMGGYNTVLEALSKGVPTVCVPRISPRSEQLIRASAFQGLGLLQISPDELTPEVLARQIDAALELRRPELMERANEILNFNGAQTSARYLLALLGAQHPTSQPSDQSHQPAPSLAGFVQAT